MSSRSRGEAKEHVIRHEWRNCCCCIVDRLIHCQYGTVTTHPVQLRRFLVVLKCMRVWQTKPKSPVVDPDCISYLQAYPAVDSISYVCMPYHTQSASTYICTCNVLPQKSRSEKDPVPFRVVPRALDPRLFGMRRKSVTNVSDGVQPSSNPFLIKPNQSFVLRLLFFGGTDSIFSLLLLLD